MNVQSVIFGIIGGLGMFIIGMKFMSDGLQNYAGGRLRKILQALTSNPAKGIIAGLTVTAVIQSSSTTTVMLVGFVNAGLMNLQQAISVILGTAVGTTITGQLIAFQIHKYALPAIGIGTPLYLFAKGKKWKTAGQVLLGFGLLFYGMSIMKGTFSFLKESEAIQNYFVLFSKNPFLGLLAGTLITLVVQSSSATVGITMALAGAGLIDFYGAFPIILGDNIGTTITAVIASIGTNLSARRVAIAHTIIKVIGASYMMALFFVQIDGVPIFLKLVDFITPGNAALGQNIERHVANSHTLFNVIDMFLFIPLIGIVAKLSKMVVRGEEEVVEHGAKHIDPRMLEVPSIAFEQARMETIRMARIANEMIDYSMAGFFDKKKFKLRRVLDRESVLDELQKEIIEFLVNLEEKELTKEDSIKSSSLMHLVNDIEKIGDYAENIVLLAQAKIDEKVKFSEEGEKELKTMYEEVSAMCKNSVEAFEKRDYDLAKKVLESEAKVDVYKVKFRADHIRRLKNGQCDSAAGIVFVEIISNLERIGDHGMKMANWLLNERGAV
ncbi:Na/Pi cotransporter family protein [Candidatus Margulisiibacteriota bacterium]